MHARHMALNKENCNGPGVSSYRKDSFGTQNLGCNLLTDTSVQFEDGKLSLAANYAHVDSSS